MRFLNTLALSLSLASPLAFGQLTPERISVETMPSPGANWFVAKSGGGARIFDAQSGEMLGQLSLSDWTPRRDHVESARGVLCGGILLQPRRAWRTH